SGGRGSAHARLVCSRRRSRLRQILIRESTKDLEGSVPSRSREEMQKEIFNVADRSSHRGIRQLFRGRVVRPINQQGFPDDVVEGDEAPVAAVERIDGCL